VLVRMFVRWMVRWPLLVLLFDIPSWW
jgi:hypothetical protein